jgi:Ca2+-binding RTX toxin-like protein
MAPPGIKECAQEGPAQMSCEPGFLDVITADLLAGDDVFWAAPGLPVLFGATLDGRERPVSGGPGRDRITVSSGADLVVGGPGRDVLILGGGGDLARGGPGRDRILGGSGQDALFGNAGRDFLHGGPARDLCNGGAGKDAGRSCAVAKKVP